jgi:DNA-binding transcriptional MerR regulator
MVRQAAPRADSGLTPPVTISRLAGHFNLARSTLLHYDRIGLLKAGAKTAAGYRLYGSDAVARLARIVELRAAGLSLETVKRVLDAKTPLGDALEKQVQELNRQIAGLREQQRVVLSLLQASVGRGGAGPAAARVMSKQGWTAMFRAIGMSDDDMDRWHQNFEKSLPEAHQEFLESLGLEAAEVQRIRRRSAGSSRC